MMADGRKSPEFREMMADAARRRWAKKRATGWRSQRELKEEARRKGIDMQPSPPIPKGKRSKRLGVDQNVAEVLRKCQQRDLVQSYKRFGGKAGYQAEIRRVAAELRDLYDRTVDEEGTWRPSLPL